MSAELQTRQAQGRGDWQMPGVQAGCINGLPCRNQILHVQTPTR